MRLLTIMGLLLLVPGHAGNAHAASGAIREQGFVTIGGVEQWITIKGDDGRNPVVLFVNGGPGNVTSADADSLYSGWEKDFTLVQWDQRGAGKTYGGSKPSGATLPLDLLAQDGIEVAEYLVRHLQTKRIVLVGNSWGSLLGVNIVKQRPGLFHAYVGTAQFVDMRENSTASYQHVVERAREYGDNSAIGELNGIGAPPWNSAARNRIFRKWCNYFQAKVATAPAPTLARSPENPRDRAGDAAAEHLFMTGPLMDVNLRKLGSDFPMPVYVIQGGADLEAAPEIAREYVEWIKAPARKFIVVPKSGHAHTRASLDALHEVLVDEVTKIGRGDSMQ